MLYSEKIQGELAKSLKLENIMEVPKLEKIIISVTTKDAVQNPKILNTVVDEITSIAGQKAVMTKSKKAISINPYTLQIKKDSVTRKTFTASNLRCSRPRLRLRFYEILMRRRPASNRCNCDNSSVITFSKG